jgi:hypothetical protein
MTNRHYSTPDLQALPNRHNLQAMLHDFEAIATHGSVSQSSSFGGLFGSHSPRQPFKRLVREFFNRSKAGIRNTQIGLAESSDTLVVQKSMILKS